MTNDIMYMEGVTVNYDGFIALDSVNLVVKQHELRFLIGPNGAGKTTILDVMCGKVKPVSGRVEYADTLDILRLNPAQICKAGISRKFQAPLVFSSLTVFENLYLAVPAGRTVFASLTSKIIPGQKEKIERVLEKIGLKDKGNEAAGNLAHGEKQWLEIGLTIIQEPKLLLVDEPVAGMTGRERERTGEILTEIAQECSVIVVEHDMQFVEAFSRNVTVLHEGQVICEGSFAHIRKDPYVIDVYLGRDSNE